MKYQGDYDLANINNTCYEICGAFSNSTDVDNMDPKCTASCKALITEQKMLQLGQSNCDHQAPYPPVLWEQVPNFVPRLVKAGMPPKKALEKCRELCIESVPTLYKECQDRCLLHYNAIELEEYKVPDEPKSEPNKKHHSKRSDTYIISIALLLILLVILYFVLRK